MNDIIAGIIVNLNNLEPSHQYGTWYSMMWVGEIDYIYWRKRKTKFNMNNYCNQFNRRKSLAAVVVDLNS